MNTPQHFSHPPYAEDLRIGIPLQAAPDITVDEGLAAQYLAICGDQLRPALSTPLSREITGRAERLVNPCLVIALSIGQSTVATGRVIANLRYDNLSLKRQLHIGETVRTTVTPIAAEWTRSGRERAKVLLNMVLTTSDGDPVATYQRLALLPVANAELLVTSPIPSAAPATLLEDFAKYIPTGWSLPAGHNSRRHVVGETWTDPLADSVSTALELARLTQNQAAAHRDARMGIDGKRLVYGGHTVALAQASLSRFSVDLVTVLAWRSCSHLLPVFEGDLLTFETRIDAIAEAGQFRVADATVMAFVHRVDSPPAAVLEWHPVLLMTGNAK